MRKAKDEKSQAKILRCAIYTRKSTEDGLEQEYNSLDAQRDSAEAYIKSQQHEGWVCAPTQYDDGGFTGANMDRPGLRRLMDDIEAGEIDCVVVYKVDRLSRSLLDFSRIMETFDKHNVAFVSVTQAFNTGSSMGRLILNVLLSFAQFEREMISERTRDKIAAARRKGKWSGGMPVLGYNVKDTKLVVDPAEAKLVKSIFELYLDTMSILKTAQVLNCRNIRTKEWVTRKGRKMGGRTFDKGAVYQLLTNRVYVGQVRHRDEYYKGEHKAIIDQITFDRVQEMLTSNGRDGGSSTRHRHDALLRRKLRCAHCDCGMSHSYTKKGNRLYRYYICQNAQRQGWAECPTPSLPAAEVEKFVIDQIATLGRNPAILRDTLAQARDQSYQAIESLESELNALRRRLRGEFAELGKQAERGEVDGDEFQAVDTRIKQAETAIAAKQTQLGTLRSEQIEEPEIIAAFQDFDDLWSSLKPDEQHRIIDMLIESVCYDGQSEDIEITYRPSGMRLFRFEFARIKNESQEPAAC